MRARRSQLRADAHPKGDVRLAAAFAIEVIEALLRSPQWERSLFFLTYDEWGGFFDHDKPPILPDSRASKIDAYNFGLGVVRAGSWILQDPEITAFSASEAYLPSRRIAIAVAVTYLPAAIDAQGNYANSADALFRSIGAVVAPNDAPPTVQGG